MRFSWLRALVCAQAACAFASIGVSVRNARIPAARLNTRESSLCPNTPQGKKSRDYKIYCSHVVDPLDASNTILPANTDVATFEACLTLCDDTEECTGLSYIEASTTCYLHTGAHRPANQRDGWNGAIRSGTEVVTTDSSVRRQSHQARAQLLALSVQAPLHRMTGGPTTPMTAARSLRAP